MRIGIITGEYPPMQGGVGDFTFQLGQALTELGHEIHVITGKSRTTNTESPLAVHRVIDKWGWGCWKQILTLAQELELNVLWVT